MYISCHFKIPGIVAATFKIIIFYVKNKKKTIITSGSREFFVSIVHATVLKALIKNTPAAKLFHNLYIKIRRRNKDVYSRRF